MGGVLNEVFARWPVALAWASLMVLVGLDVEPRVCRAACCDVPEVVSVSTTGERGSGSSSDPSLSADGRFVAFTSWARNLVPGDTNDAGDIFVRDRSAGTTEIVSVSSSGDQGNADSYLPCISSDGRFVAFGSRATNLVADDTNGVSDVFVHDRVAGTTERVSVSSGGLQADDAAWPPSISGDGRYVAFPSRATNLVPDDTNGAYDVFVHDRLTRTTQRVSVTSAGEQGNRESYCGEYAVSADGRYVVFSSRADNLVPGDFNEVSDVFVRDRQTSQTSRLSVTRDGSEANGASSGARISGNGRYLCFWSDATNLAEGPSAYVNLILLDRATAHAIKVADRHPEAPYGWNFALSADGRYVALDVYSEEWYPPEPPEAHSWVVVCDTVAGHSPCGPFFEVWDPALSPDGRYVAFAQGPPPNYTGDVVICDLTDGTPPRTEILEGPCGEVTCSSSATAAWSGSDDRTPVQSLTFAWRLDGGSWSAWTTDTSTTLTGLSQGQHVIEVKARDLTGNEDPTPARCEFTVALSPPTVSITSPANGATVRSTITITATVSQGAGLTASAKTIPSAFSSPLRGGGLRWGAGPVWHSRPRLCSDGQAGAPVPHTDMPAAGTAALQADGIERVEFYVNGQLLCTDTTTPYTCQWDTIGRRGGPPWPPLPPTAAAFGQARGPAPTNSPAQICVKAFDRCGRSAQRCITVTVRNQTFEDVPPDNPTFPYIEAVAARGITSGWLPAEGATGLPLFCPYASATKAQVAVFLCKAAGKTWLDRPTPTFADVPKDNPYYGWIERFCDPASWGGTAPGTPCAIFGGKKFCPTASVSRREIAWVLCRATGKAPLDRPAPTFIDVPTGSPFCPWIERLADPASWPGGVSVTSGCACPSTYPQPAKCYCPKSPLTRAQLAVLLVRAFGIPL
jgi:Tol biopolymer transport system component